MTSISTVIIDFWTTSAVWLNMKFTPTVFFYQLQLYFHGRRHVYVFSLCSKQTSWLVEHESSSGVKDVFSIRSYICPRVETIVISRSKISYWEKAFYIFVVENDWKIVLNNFRERYVSCGDFQFCIPYWH